MVQIWSATHSVPSFSHSSHPDASGVIGGVSEAIAAMECLAATTTAMVYMVTGQ
jgi:hypothetical protein